MTVKTKELRELSVSELNSRLTGAYQERFNLRLQHSTKQLGNPARLGEMRRTIARIKTIMRERQALESV